MMNFNIDPKHSIEDSFIAILVKLVQDGQTTKSCCMRFNTYEQLKKELGTRLRLVEKNGFESIEILGPQGLFHVFSHSGVAENQITFHIESEDDKERKLQARISDMKKHVKAIKQRIELGVSKSQEEKLTAAIIRLGLCIDELEVPLIEKSVAGLLKKTKELLA